MKDNNPNTKKPRFVSYWIYAVILIVIIGFQFFSGGSSWQKLSQTTPSELQEFLKNGDVEKILIITNTRNAKVFLKDEALEKDVHKGVNSKTLLPSNTKVPSYELKFGDLQNFENETKKTITDNNLETIIEYDQESNYFAEIIGFILPFLLILGLWIFFMRRMSGGGSGGAGAQIFNIGKSKARLFDEKLDTRVTFKDVAGLEGAKEEVEEIVEFLKNP